MAERVLPHHQAVRTQRPAAVRLQRWQAVTVQLPQHLMRPPGWCQVVPAVHLLGCGDMEGGGVGRGLVWQMNRWVGAPHAMAWQQQDLAEVVVDV